MTPTGTTTWQRSGTGWLLHARGHTLSLNCPHADGATPTGDCWPPAELGCGCGGTHILAGPYPPARHPTWLYSHRPT